MTRQLWRAAAMSLVLVLAAACGNSSDDTSPTTTQGDGGSSTTAAPGGGDRDTFVPLSGVPGVTDEAITFAAIGTRANNPLGTCILDCYIDGIEAYFAFRNDEGGIFGRDLVLGPQLDDELGANQTRSLEVISSDEAFGVFQATLLGTGWGDLDAAGVPTYVWGIDGEGAANRANIFPSTIIQCGDCTNRAVPYAVGDAGATKVASIGYGISDSSKVCTQANAASIEKYGADIGAELVYTNDSLDYGLANGVGPEVTAMKDAGVDFITTCIDLNGMKTLAQELDRQGMSDVVLYHPNTYDQRFVAEAGDLFEGDYVAVQFLPFEADTTGTALEDFLTWMDKQGSEPTELAMAGWINASLAFDGLLAAGPEFDRASVVAATNSLTDFDAGGLLEPVDWTSAHTPYTEANRSVDATDECSTMVKVEGGEFTTVAPAATPWLCWGADLAWAEPEPTSFG